MVSLNAYIGLCMISRGFIYSYIGPDIVKQLRLYIPATFFADFTFSLSVLIVPLFFFDVGTYYWRPMGIFSLLFEVFLAMKCSNNNVATFFVLRSAFLMWFLSLERDISDVLKDFVQYLINFIDFWNRSAKTECLLASLELNLLEERYHHVLIFNSKSLPDENISNEIKKMHRFYERKKKRIELKFTG